MYLTLQVVVMQQARQSVEVGTNCNEAMIAFQIMLLILAIEGGQPRVSDPVQVVVGSNRMFRRHRGKTSTGHAYLQE